MTRFVAVACSMSAVGVLAGRAAADLYTFNPTSQGWTVYDIPYTGSHINGGRAVGGQAAPLDATAGQPAPSLRVADLAGETWIGAPVASLGARNELYGQVFAFDIYFRTRDNATYGSVGVEGPALSLWIAEPAPTLEMWLHRSYAFAPGAWHVDSIAGPLATEAQIRAVLANVTGFYIHTEWTTGPDDTSVDNVLIGTPPPAGCGPADVGAAGGVAGADGQLNNNDFVVFIDMFFAHNAAADRGVQGGIAGTDGQWDNNDFIVFIDQFFAGC
jgi:hypothetical protein